MVGSGRKRKKEEKAKTQLKKPKTAPGKHLPKGTNETRTQFKVAKIVVPGQKGESGSQGAAGGVGPVTTKKLTLKDVLGKISHFSNAVRTDGLEGLKELLLGTSAPSLVSANLSSILGALMPVVQDRERKMRKLATACISEVMAHTPASSLAPLHPLLSAHLCCALTHIDPRIQQDALNTLDCLLQQAPNFISDTAALLLPNCLDQISAKKQAQGTEKKNTSGPHVAANLSETMSSLQWRLNVLSRIEKILEIVTPSSLLATKCPPPLVKFTPGASLPVYTSSPPAMPLSSLGTSSSSSSLQQHLTSVMPLLLETWVEARAEEEKEGRKKNKSSVLSKEVAELLACEAGILNKLLRLMDEKVLDKTIEKSGSDIETHFINPLPYSCQTATLAETNVLLTVVAITLGKIPSDEVLLTILKSKAPSGSRLALVKGLTQGPHKIEHKVEEACVATLMDIHAGRGIEGDEAGKLLVEECLKGKSGLVVNWVKELPSRLLSCLLDTNDEEKDKLGSDKEEEALALADSCLVLAKAGNVELAPTFLANLKDIQDNAPADTDLLRQKLDWARQHLSRIPAVC